MVDTVTWELVLSVVLDILTGLIICIPLILELRDKVKELIREGNWNKIVALVADLMTAAEKLFDKGADRKEWVLGYLKREADKLDYNMTDLELSKIGDMIDDLCEMAKIVNVNPSQPASITKRRDALWT